MTRGMSEKTLRLAATATCKVKLKKDANLNYMKNSRNMLKLKFLPRIKRALFRRQKASPTLAYSKIYALLTNLS